MSGSGSVRKMKRYMLRRQPAAGGGLLARLAQLKVLRSTHSALSALRVAERVRERIAQEKFGEGQPVSVTVSIGVAEFPGHGDTAQALIAAADAALYDAKRAGKNLTREGLIIALEGIKGFESGILPPITIGPDHETQNQGFWVRVEKGRFKPLTDWLKSE